MELQPRDRNREGVLQMIGRYWTPSDHAFQLRHLLGIQELQQIVHVSDRDRRAKVVRELIPHSVQPEVLIAFGWMKSVKGNRKVDLIREAQSVCVDGVGVRQPTLDDLYEGRFGVKMAAHNDAQVIFGVEFCEELLGVKIAET
jgi:hypothetical protein